MSQLSTFIGKRLLWLTSIVVVVTFITFWLLNLLPGDPCTLSSGSGATEENLARCRDNLKLGSNLFVRYFDWLTDCLTGDFGESYRNGIEVSTILAQKLPATSWLILYTMVLTLLISIPLGTIAAYRRNSWVDSTISTTSFGMLSIPAFVLGSIMVLVFSVQFKWFPLGGYVGPTENLIEHWKSLFLPALTLALGSAPIYVQLLRADMVQNLEENFTAVVRAKGLPTRKLIFRHLLRPSSFTLVTLAGINAAQLINATVVVEFIFNVAGVGSFLIDSVFAQDYLVVQTITALIATAFVVLNALVDAIYLVLDPRVRTRKLT